MEAAQRRPAGEPPPPLAHLPLQLAPELRLLHHSCAVIAQITHRPPCAPPSRVGAAPLDMKPSQTCTFLNKYLILKRRCGSTDALKPEAGLSSPPRSARSSRERSSSSEETSRHASGSVHSSSSLTAAPLASSGETLDLWMFVETLRLQRAKLNQRSNGTETRLPQTSVLSRPRP